MATVCFPVADPVDAEIAVDVFKRIQAEAIDADAVKHPLAPVFELAADLGVIHVEITTH
jgi:hypothetical protein